MVEITRKLEFDAGHRIPDHGSKCRNAHGHRYVIEATVTGDLVEKVGASDRGMVVDFGDLKTIMNDHIVEPWDHAFLVCTADYLMIGALAVLGPDHKTVHMHDVPTVENLVRLAGKTLDEAIGRCGSWHLTHVRLYETPNCWADWYPPNPSTET